MATKRSTFSEIEPLEGVQPTERELRWLQHIACHGPQSSQYLFELTRDTHSCKDTALRQLRKLRAAGFLYLPQQQRGIEKADFKPYIYELSKSGQEILDQNGLLEPHVRPVGHWWHGYFVACVTSSVQIFGARQGIRYIPACAILAKKNTSLPIPITTGKVIPDQLFALDYGGAFRAFVLEVDNGTEPLSSANARKSLARSIDQYAEIVEKELHKAYFGLKTNMLILWVFSSRTRQEGFLRILERKHNGIRRQVLSTCVDRNDVFIRPHEDFQNNAWERAGLPPFKL